MRELRESFRPNPAPCRNSFRRKRPSVSFIGQSSKVPSISKISLSTHIIPDAKRAIPKEQIVEYAS